MANPFVHFIHSSKQILSSDAGDGNTKDSIPWMCLLQLLLLLKMIMMMTIMIYSSYGASLCRDSMTLWNISTQDVHCGFDANNHHHDDDDEDEMQRILYFYGHFWSPVYMNVWMYVCMDVWLIHACGLVYWLTQNKFT